MATTAEQKRRFARIKFQAPLRYQIRGTSEFNNAITDNISIGGIGFTHSEFITPKTLLMLELNILSQVLNPIGRVAWSSPLPHSDRYRVGIEFLELDTKDKNYLTDYINMQIGNL